MFRYQRNRLIIIDSIIIIALLLYFLSTLIHRPYMHITIAYDAVPPVSTNLLFNHINVIYRGYSVGYVRKIKLSQDQQHIEFLVNIMYKGLKIPKNSIIIFKPENLYGSRYLDISLPKEPAKELLVNGDTINGVAAYERFDQYLLEDMKSGKMGQMVVNIRDLTDELKKALKNKDNSKLLYKSSGDLAVILEDIRSITQDPRVKRDIKSTIRNSSVSLKSINDILGNEDVKNTIVNSPETIQKTIDNIELMNEHMGQAMETLPNINKTLSEANVLLSNSNENLSSINTKVPAVPPSLIENAESLLIKTDCFETEVSKMLSKRALFLRFFFGNPGKSFEKCSVDKCKPRHECVHQKNKCIKKED